MLASYLFLLVKSAVVLIRFTVQFFSLKTLRLSVAYTEIPEVWNSGAHSAEAGQGHV